MKYDHPIQLCLFDEEEYTKFPWEYEEPRPLVEDWTRNCDE